jgi:hypothetical protein
VQVDELESDPLVSDALDAVVDVALDELAFTPIGGEINTVLVNPWEGCTGLELLELIALELTLEQFDPEESVLHVIPSEQYP